MIAAITMPGARSQRTLSLSTHTITDTPLMHTARNVFSALVWWMLPVPIRLSDEINVDLAADGTVYGIELLNANAQLRACDEGHFVLVDETAGRRVEVPLPEVA